MFRERLGHLGIKRLNLLADLLRLARQPAADFLALQLLQRTSV
jgi:hypothetical protein